MEEDVGPGGRVGVSKSPLSSELHSELVESMDCENQLEGSYEEGDGGEIMVEVVGSDVFVNGVGGHNGDFVGSEWENRVENGCQNFPEVMDVWDEVDGSKMGESEVGFLESRAVGVLDEEVWNPGIEAIVLSSSAVIESVTEQTEEVMERTILVIGEEKVVKCKAVDRDSANFVTCELLNRPVEAVVEREVRSSEKEEMLPSRGNDADLDQLVDDSITSHEVNGASDGAHVVPSELPLNPTATEGGGVLASDSPKDGVFKVKAELASTDSDCRIKAKNVDEKEVFGAESKGSIVKMDAIVSVVRDDNQGCLDELRGTKFGPTHGTDDASHTSSGSQPDGGGIAEVSQPAGVKIEIQADTEENQPNMVTLCSPGDTGIVRADFGIHVNDPHVATSMGDVITDRKVAVSQVKVVDGDGSCEKDKEIDSKLSVQSLESPGNAEMPVVEGLTSVTELMDVKEERESDGNYDGGMIVDCRGPGLGTEERASETDKFKLSTEETVKSARLFKMYQPGYLSNPENEGHFARSDLVWGKIRSHRSWPGQIFAQADASEKALKCYKKDSYLVACFGDRAFAWNDKSVLKPFMPCFSQIEKQSDSEAFQNAVNCALEEISRRVELGLACSCIPKDAYIKIGTQVIENAGIREESSRRCGVYHSSRATSFQPDKLLEYIRNLAPCASSWADRLDLVIARAQLSAFYCFKGYRSPTEFPSSGELLENDADTEKVSDEMVASHKRRHTPMEGSHSRKERSLTELMADREYCSVAEDIGKSVSVFSERKRKAIDPLANGSGKSVSIHAAKFSTSTSHTPKYSFKISECISRLASQSMGPTSSVKGNKDEMVIDGSPKIYEHSEKKNVVVSAESFSVNEMLSQLRLVAQDPKKMQNIQNSVHAFFWGFRSSVVLNRRDRKRKAEPTIGRSVERFEFDDANDSYWKDRIVQNYSGEQLRHEWENRTANLQPVPLGAEKSVETGSKSHSRKKFSFGNYPKAATESDDSVKRRKQESSPAELILNFAERKCVPSEINLNKMFRRFGPLMESETEVDHDSGRARVIFKRGSDAEVALNSAEKFNIFETVRVKYQIGYTPLISVKILPLAVPQCPEDETLML